jgi:hypothetical protein
MRPISRFECVELLVTDPNNVTKVEFDDIPQLRSDADKDCVIRAIQVYAAEEIPNSFNQNPLVTEAMLGLCFLTLYIDTEESIKSMPMLQLRQMNRSPAAGATTDSFWTDEKNQFLNLKIDWTKSFITPSAAMGNDGNIAFLLGVEYIYANPGSYQLYKQNRTNAWAMGMYPQ